VHDRDRRFACRKRGEDAEGPRPRQRERANRRRLSRLAGLRSVRCYRRDRRARPCAAGPYRPAQGGRAHRHAGRAGRRNAAAHCGREGRDIILVRFVPFTRSN
jgi:hypothetical protein